MRLGLYKYLRQNLLLKPALSENVRFRTRVFMVYESRQNGFRTWPYFSTSVSYRYFGAILWLLSQNPKNNCLFHNHDNTKNRFPRLCSEKGMNVGVMRATGHYYQSSGKGVALLPLSPLRTVRERFHSYGSSLV